METDYASNEFRTDGSVYQLPPNELACDASQKDWPTIEVDFDQERKSRIYLCDDHAAEKGLIW
jgi:hypothetical protein